MTNEIILAGFGGQGILFAGKLLAYCAMVMEKELSWLPSYGPEMRGGTCNCHVIVADEPVSSPLICNPSILLTMNLPSLDKFEKTVQSGGYIVLDSSMIQRDVLRTDVSVIKIPASQIARELNATKLANMIIVGAMVKSTGLASLDVLKEALKKTIPASKTELYDINLKCIEAGYNY